MKDTPMRLAWKVYERTKKKSSEIKVLSLNFLTDLLFNIFFGDVLSFFSASFLFRLVAGGCKWEQGNAHTMGPEKNKKEAKHHPSRWKETMHHPVSAARSPALVTSWEMPGRREPAFMEHCSCIRGNLRAPEMWLVSGYRRCRVKRKNEE